MILNFIRKKIYQRTHFARQKWLSKKQLHKKNFFNYLNLEYKRYGTKNPNKFFYVIKRAPGAGFFSNLNFVIHNLYIAEKLKMIPVVDMENFQTFYNCKNKINNTYNSWEYYFKPVSNYKLSEVYKSKNVVFCDKVRSAGYNFKDKKHLSYFHGFQYLNNKHKTIAKKYIKINDTILKEANILKKKIYNKKVLGICFRGSDSKTNAYVPHTPTKKQMIYATNKLIEKYNFEKIYLCTEDIDYLNFYKKNFGSILIYNSKSPRTSDKVDLFDSNDVGHRYKIGKGNIVDMLLLSKSQHMLFCVSNIPYTALFFATKKIPHSIIDNGIRGGLIKSLFSWRIKSLIPVLFGGFKNHFITKKNIIKPKNSDFDRY